MAIPVYAKSSDAAGTDVAIVRWPAHCAWPAAGCVSGRHAAVAQQRVDAGLAASEDFVKVSGGLLLLYGIGTVIGPTIGGPVMSMISPHALFLVTAVAHVLITGYAIIRSRIRAAVPVGDRDAYTTIPTGTSQMLTPQSMSLADRGTGKSAETGKSPESGDPAVKFG